jgi:hypothetical protein
MTDFNDPNSTGLTIPWLLRIKIAIPSPRLHPAPRERAGSCMIPFSARDERAIPRQEGRSVDMEVFGVQFLGSVRCSSVDIGLRQGTMLAAGTSRG